MRTLGSLLQGNSEIRATKMDDVLVAVGHKSKLAEDSGTRCAPACVLTLPVDADDDVEQGSWNPDED